MDADSNWARAQGAREVVSAASIGENGRFLVPKRQRVAVVGATRATHQSKVDRALALCRTARLPSGRGCAGAAQRRHVEQARVVFNMIRTRPAVRVPAFLKLLRAQQERNRAPRIPSAGARPPARSGMATRLPGGEA
jgi:hypothetical protein